MDRRPPGIPEARPEDVDRTGEMRPGHDADVFVVGIADRPFPVDAGDPEDVGDGKFSVQFEDVEGGGGIGDVGLTPDPVLIRPGECVRLRS